MLERLMDLPRGIDGVNAVGKVSKEDHENVFAPLLDEARREGAIVSDVGGLQESARLVTKRSKLQSRGRKGGAGPSPVSPTAGRPSAETRI